MSSVKDIMLKVGVDSSAFERSFVDIGRSGLFKLTGGDIPEWIDPAIQNTCKYCDTANDGLDCKNCGAPK